MRAWGPGTVPLACMPCVGVRAAGVVGGRPGGVASHHCEGRLVSGAVPLLAACPWGGHPGHRYPSLAGAGGVGVGTQHWPHSACSCEPALRAVGVAGRCLRGGRVPRAIVRGRLGLGARPPLAARPSGR